MTSLSVMFHSLAVIAFVCISHAVGELPCPGSGVAPYKGRCYIESDSAGLKDMTFDDGRAWCKSQGGDLISMEDQAEYHYICNNYDQDYWDTHLLTGLITEDGGKTWTYVDGTDSTWAAKFTDGGSSDKKQARDCVFATGGDHCDDNDWDPTDTWTIGCKIPAPVPPPPPPPPLRKCDIKIKKKAHKDATRTITLYNEEAGSCFIKVSRKGPKPSLVKVTRYNFPSEAEECTTGFAITRQEVKAGEPVPNVEKICGRSIIPMKKKSGRKEPLYIIFFMDGCGKKLLFRSKGKTFKPNA